MVVWCAQNAQFDVAQTKQRCKYTGYTASADIHKRTVKRGSHSFRICVPVWPSGKALVWYSRGTSAESDSALIFLQKLWAVDTFLSLCPSQL